MFDRLLLPTDGTDAMDQIVDLAREAAAPGATVHLLYVVDDRAFLTLDPSLRDDALDDIRGRGEDALATHADVLTEAGLTVETAMRQGDPADGILGYARDNDVDGIVMGTHGDVYEQNMVGSVARKVVANARIPVISLNVVRNDRNGV